jgi:hypothetical protein
MKFEIKSRFDGSILFSLETDLRGADLGGVQLLLKHL